MNATKGLTFEEDCNKYLEYCRQRKLKQRTINMTFPEENYYFILTEDYDGGKNELTISLLVNDGTLEVYNMIPDDVQSRLATVNSHNE